MNPFDPILDQPQSIDYDAVDPAARYLLGNQDITFEADSTTDLQNLVWPWADATYVRSITLRISDPQHEELTPMVTRYFPGYQETILGSEGMIISKRLAAPLGSAYDRSVMWVLECQAEGDQILRLDVEVDWGQPLTQRIVDGLLVAQRNPGQARGIYAQHNADSTRVFGNPQGRASAVVLEADGRARLTYIILVNGIVEVPLLLTLSDVGEQMAWNGFLGLREAERAFELSVEAWDKIVKTGRLWTPDPQFNRAVQQGRLITLRTVQRLRSGLAPTDRDIDHVPALVKALDACDLTLSRNLLAHLRSVAERSAGNLPRYLPVRRKDPVDAPGRRLGWNNSLYLETLTAHLRRHPDPELLEAHYEAVSRCAEVLVQIRVEAQNQGDGPLFAAAGAGLRHAVTLATLHRDSTNAVRWESEACELERMADEAGASVAPKPGFQLSDWAAQTGWQFAEDRVWHFRDPWQGVVLAGEAVWGSYGVQPRRDQLAVYPARGNDWRWWALMDLPVGEGHISLVWDGETLHSTHPVRSDKPVRVYDKIHALSTEEVDFDLHFEMIPPEEEGGQEAREIFHPAFDQPEEEPESG